MGSQLSVVDEADRLLNTNYFFYPRGSAVRSWEISHTNELLTQMENFNGVLICTTNFLCGLDQASLRRFKFKIEFRPLSPAGNLRMYKGMFSSLTEIPLDREAERRILALKNLTPGDFRVVADKFALLNSAISHDRLIESLEEELNHKSIKLPLGF